MTLSKPCRAMLASRGEITPPCGVPSVVGNSVSSIHDPRPQPGSDGPPERGKGLELLEQRVVVDAVKALGDIGVQHVFRLGLDGVEDGSDGIMA